MAASNSSSTIVIIALVIAGGGAWYFWKEMSGEAQSARAPRTASLAQLNLAPQAAMVGEIEGALERVARQWDPGAQRWALHIQGVRPNGSIDLSRDGRVSATWVVPSRLAAPQLEVRHGAVRQAQLGSDGLHLSMVDEAALAKVTQTPSVPPWGACDLMHLIASLALAPNQTVAVSHAPDAGHGAHWHVQGAGKDGWYALSNCQRRP